MKPKTFYLVLCVLSSILPYWFFVPFVRAHGLDVRLFIELLFANSISSFFAMDVIVSSLCLWVFVYFERRRSGVKHLWAPIVANVLVGVSLGLPLFLYMREQRIGNQG
jgi:hypothetical protein